MPGRPVRIVRRQAPLPRRPRQPPDRPPDAACLCDGTPTGLVAAIHVDGDHAAELIAGFWQHHSGGRHTPTDRIPDRPGKGDPKW
jgi:hypothetical protein